MTIMIKGEWRGQNGGTKILLAKTIHVYSITHGNNLAISIILIFYLPVTLIWMRKQPMMPLKSGKCS